MESQSVLPKEISRIPRKPERPYISTLKSSPMESRRRPLRTYSKRTFSETAEPAPKRRCIADASKAPTPTVLAAEAKSSIASSQRKQECDKENEHNAKSLASAPGANANELPLPTPKKGTIMAYFAPKIHQLPVIAPSSEPEPSSDPVSESNDLTITPPSSPPMITFSTRKRRVRRLKTRIVAQRVDEEAEDEEESGNEGASSESEEQRQRHDSMRDRRGTCTTTDTSTERKRRIRDRPLAPLSELAHDNPNLNPNLNLPTTSTKSKPRLDGNMEEQKENRPDQREKKKQKPAPQASVQTTLSLSMHEAHYTECRECGMLYNHLHETDVKYHARRHAAALKKAVRDRSREVDE
ncbi:hypothetical protein F4808DRAFT_61644 [Astrocystis sublimbata]|nr:hypothetical protein F4808DRAFT_61644 [Astrocystis sublimbata]